LNNKTTNLAVSSSSPEGSSTTSGAAKRKAKIPKRWTSNKNARLDTESSFSRLAEAETKINTLEKQLEETEKRRNEAEQQLEALRQELLQSRAQISQEAEHKSRQLDIIKSALEVSAREAAVRAAREERKNLGNESFELGRLVYRAGLGRDTWEDGDADRQLRKKADILVKKKEALKKANAATKNQNKPCPHGFEALDFIAEEEFFKAKAAALRREESELSNERVELDLKKISHVRAWSRAKAEDTSRFRHRPVLHKRYLLLSLLGKGGFSEVWLALDLENPKEHVAIKLHELDPTWTDDKKRAYVRHVAREYSIQRDLDHPTVVKLLDVFEVDADAFATVLEYCDGADLESLLKARKLLSEKEAKPILLQVLAGLKHLHTPQRLPNGRTRGPIIHFDLKPGNILFDHLGRVKITDFGLSKILPNFNNTNTMNGAATSLELTSQGAGTYWYLPPECFARPTVTNRLPPTSEDHQVLQTQNISSVPKGPRINPSVDVWSVGVIFYQMLFGGRPFGEGQTQASLLSERTMLTAGYHGVDFPPKPTISEDAKDFIRLCLRHSQAERPNIKTLCDHKYVCAHLHSGKLASSSSTTKTS